MLAGPMKESSYNEIVMNDVMEAALKVCIDNPNVTREGLSPILVHY